MDTWITWVLPECVPSEWRVPQPWKNRFTSIGNLRPALNWEVIENFNWCQQRPSQRVVTNTDLYQTNKCSKWDDFSLWEFPTRWYIVWHTQVWHTQVCQFFKHSALGFLLKKYCIFRTVWNFHISKYSCKTLHQKDYPGVSSMPSRNFLCA